VTKEIDEARRILKEAVPLAFETLAELADNPKEGAKARRTLKTYLSALKALCEDPATPAIKRKSLQAIYDRFSKL
jgi:hypothetical protein